MAKKRRPWNLKGIIISHLRKIFFYSPLRQTVANGVKQKVGYKCDKCKKKVDKIKVDHIDPVVDPKTGFIDWNTFINRLFCDVALLQALCEVCHDKKTASEKAIRQANKKKD